MESEHPQEKPQEPTTLPHVKEDVATHKVVFLIIGIAILVIGLLGGYLLLRNGQISSTSTPTQTISPSEKAMPLTSLSGVPIKREKSDWSTYKNNKYGFEIMYPKSYRVLDDKDSLYGWPNGVALIYKGGQSYDIVIEVWDTQVDYETKYSQSQGNFDLIVEKIGDKYVTVLNSTNDPDNAEIIATFKLTK